jgi:alkylated DNA repair dioxygenase AlkB
LAEFFVGPPAIISSGSVAFVLISSVQTDFFMSEKSQGIETVPGFSIQFDYITAEEERELISHVDAGEWNTDWRRRVQRYGLGYGESATGSEFRDFPGWLKPLAARVGKYSGFARFPDNCVINEYLSGQGIAPHKDYSNFGPTVACVSLGSDTILDLYSEDRSRRVAVHVPRRSLWILGGEARSKWLHGIAPRLNDVINGARTPRQRRISITFRTA